MKITNPSLLFQHILAYAAIVMAVLTQAVSGIHLDPAASAVLGTFGILVHPQTSITATTTTPTSEKPVA